MKIQIILRDDKTRARLYETLEGLDRDKWWRVDIVEAKGKRKLCQNALMWHWLTYFARWTHERGSKLYSAKDWKEYLQEILGYMVVVEKPNGQMKQIPEPTSEMTTKRMAEWLADLDHYLGSEYGCVLPRREDDYYIAMGIR